MTRQCCYCKEEIGEKCPCCGAPAALVRTLEWPGVEAFYICNSQEPAALNRCTGRIFEKGLGGVTSGACDPCYAKLRSAKPNGKEVQV